MVGMMYRGVMYGGDDVWWGWCIVGMMYRGDYEGVHQGNIGWVVVDH